MKLGVCPKKHEARSARLPFECLVPGRFDGVIGVLPFELFRPLQVKLERSEALRVFLSGPGWLPCDGRSVELERTVTLPVGDFIGLRVMNTTDQEAKLVAVLHGRTVKTQGDISGRVLRGACL